MEEVFQIRVVESAGGVIRLECRISHEESTEVIVQSAVRSLLALDLAGGTGVIVDGSAPLAAAAAMGHHLAHRFGFVAWWNPPLQKAIVAIAHGTVHRVGDLIDG